MKYKCLNIRVYGTKKETRLNSSFFILKCKKVLITLLNIIKGTNLSTKFES